VPAVSTCTLLTTVRAIGSFLLLSSPSSVTATSTSTRVPGSTKPATPDHLVHAHRDGAHAGRDDRREARARLRAGDARGGDRLVQIDRRDDAAIDQLRRIGERAFERCPRRPGRDLQVVVVSRVPTGRARVATTTGTVSISTWRTACA
jgi:hypothetical protein